MVVGIIGVLAAVAIPAYQKYQRSAEINIVKNTLSQIAKAFPICLTSANFGTCKSPTISGTLSSQDGASIALGTGSPATKACFEVTNENSLKGCIDFTDDGLGKAGTIKVGYPIGTPCSQIKPTCTGGASTPILSNGTIACSGGCTLVVDTGADTCTINTVTSVGDADNCGTGTSTSAVNAECSSGECG